jgi:Transposase domain (DUF772)
MKTKPTTRPMTKSLRRVAREAYALGRETLPDSTCRTSRQDYTQAQLFAILALKTFLKTDYRGAVAILDDFAELRQDLGLAKVPDHTTLWHAQRRLLQKGASARSSGGRSAAPASAA